MAVLKDTYVGEKGGYLFSEISEKIKAYRARNSGREVIRLDIGDVTEPLPKPVTDAMERAARELSVQSTFRGYGEVRGYLFLRETICDYYRRNTGVILDADEIFVSDGAKSDIANFQELFDLSVPAIIQNPVYPVYRDSNSLSGRRIKYIDCNAQNGYLPLPPTEFTESSLIYLCSPNNPTGVAYARKELRLWVDYAVETQSVILFDGAYEAFVEDEDVPRSIYEIPNADKCAVEFCSLSKTAGFTGVRCGYTVVPKSVFVDGISLNGAWLKRQTTKFNGVSYITQRGAKVALSEECAPLIKANLAYYKRNAELIFKTFTQAGYGLTGCRNSPYAFIDVKTDDIKFFDKLLNDSGVSVTPGSGFGTNGRNHIRLTSFGRYEKTAEALNRIRQTLNKI